MFLRSLSIENFRALRDVELSFTQPADADATPARKGAKRKEHNRRWTVLLGENGTGKSSLLRAIALLLAGSDALPELLGDPDQWITLGQRQCRIAASLQTQDGELRELELVLERGDTVSDVLKRAAKSLASLDAALRHTPRSYLVCGYGVSRRLPSGRKRTSLGDEIVRAPRAQAVATLFLPEAELTSIEGWAFDVHYRLGEQGFDIIRETLDGLLPGAKLSRIDRKKRQLLFKTADGVVPLSQLSDGFQNVAAWVGDLLFRITETFEDRRRPLHARGLLLIDELELHLHPAWQRTLRDFLTRKLPNFQIVATSHGALTAQQAAEGELFVFERDAGGRTALVPFAGDPQQLLVHQLLLSNAFGLSTLKSRHAEELRREYEALAGKPRKSPTERRRTLELASELSGVPDPSALSEAEQRTAAFVERLATRLIPAKEREEALLSNRAPAARNGAKPRGRKPAARKSTARKSTAGKAKSRKHGTRAPIAR